MRLNPLPGYVILKPHTLNKKIGNFEMPKGDTEDAPEVGKVVAVGDPLSKMPYDAKHVPKVNDVIAYKKYNHFVMTLGVKKYIAVHFENLLFKVEEADE